MVWAMRPARRSNSSDWAAATTKSWVDAAGGAGWAYSGAGAESAAISAAAPAKANVRITGTSW